MANLKCPRCKVLTKPVDVPILGSNVGLMIPTWQCVDCGRTIRSEITEEIYRISWSESDTHIALLERALIKKR